jgi:hypothetical protein
MRDIILIFMHFFKLRKRHVILENKVQSLLGVFNPWCPNTFTVNKLPYKVVFMKLFSLIRNSFFSIGDKCFVQK